MKTLKQLFNEARQLSLTAEEKAQAKHILRAQMALQPLAKPTLLGWRLLFKPLTLVAVVVLLLSGGVSLAAEKALPGEFLYPVKVNFNEEMRALWAISATAKANLDTELATRRLEEAEKLSAQAKLSPQVRVQLETKFQAHVERVKTQVAKVASQDTEAAAAVTADFEASLKAHNQILTELSGTNKRQAQELQPILVKVMVEQQVASDERVKADKKTAARADVEAVAEGRREAAKNKIEEVEGFIQKQTERSGVEVMARAKARLAQARKLFAEGEAKLFAEDYNAAFKLFGQAHTTAQEAKLLARARLEREEENDGEKATPTPSSSVSATPDSTISPTPEIDITASGSVQFDLEEEDEIGEGN